MPLKLMFITNDPDIAAIAQEAGVDRVWIDLEKLGKAERQANINSVKSNHSENDVRRLRPILSKSQLLVRIDPLNPNSQKQIDQVVDYGADIIMLPMFRSTKDADCFVKMVKGRTKTMLLLETIDAEKSIGEVVHVGGIDEIHIGLNDLHLEHKMHFMFELLADGTVDRLCEIIGSAGIPYGFGGVARLGTGTLPAEKIIAEHYRLGSSMVILSRGFCPQANDTAKDYLTISKDFSHSVAELRKFERELFQKDAAYFLTNKSDVDNCVKRITHNILVPIKAI